MKKATEKERKPIVVGIGELLWDMLPTGKKAGGAPINFVYYASRLGAEGYAISAIGDDTLGKEIIEELDKYQIQHLIEKVPYPTGTVKVELDEEGVPSYTISERVAWDHIIATSNAIDLAEQADAICFGTLAQRSTQSRETIQAISSFAPADAYRLYDINLRQRYYNKELIEESFYLANVLKANREEFKILKGLFELEKSDREAAHWFMEKYSLRMVALTAGAMPSTIYTREETSTLPSPEIPVVDTVGAGDAFAAGLIISLIKGKSLREAHEAAVATATFVCTQEGAWPDYEKW